MIKIITNLYFCAGNPVPENTSTKIVELRTEDDLIYGRYYLKVATDSLGNTWYAQSYPSGTDYFICKNNYAVAIGSQDYDNNYPKLISSSPALVYYTNQVEYSKAESFYLYLQKQAERVVNISYVLGEGRAEDPANYSDYDGAPGVISTGVITGTDKTLIGEVPCGVPHWISTALDYYGSVVTNYSLYNIYASVELTPYKPEKNQTLRQIYPDVPTDINRVPDKLDLSEYDSLQGFFDNYTTDTSILYDVRSYTNPDTIPSGIVDALYIGEGESIAFSGYVLSKYKLVAITGSNGDIITVDKRYIMNITSTLSYTTHENRVKYKATNSSPVTWTLAQVNSADIENRVTDSVARYLWYNGNSNEFRFPGTGTLYKINGLYFPSTITKISGVKPPNAYYHYVNSNADGDSNWTITYGIYDGDQFPGIQVIYEIQDGNRTEVPFAWCFNGNFLISVLMSRMYSILGELPSSFDSLLQGYDFIEDPDMGLVNNIQEVYDVNFNYGSHTFEKESNFKSNISSSNLSSTKFKVADGVHSLSTVLVNNDGLSLRKHYPSSQLNGTLFLRTVSETTPFGTHEFKQLIGVSSSNSQLGSIYRLGGNTTGETIDTLIFTGSTQGYVYYSSSNLQSYSLTRIYGSHTYLGVNCALVEWPEVIDFQDGWRNYLYGSTYTESQSGLNKFYFYIPESYSGKEIDFSIPGFSQINLVGPDIDISNFSGYTEYRTYRDGNILTLYPN